MNEWEKFIQIYQSSSKSDAIKFADKMTNEDDKNSAIIFLNMKHPKHENSNQSDLVTDFLENGSGIITLCGSTRFFFEAMECNKLLTFMNWAVFQCGSWAQSFDKYSDPSDLDYSTVKKLHFQKIMLSQAIVVVTDPTGYVGSSTKAEIAFTKGLEKPVFYFDGVEFSGSAIRKPVDYFADSYLIDAFEVANDGLGF